MAKRSRDRAEPPPDEVSAAPPRVLLIDDGAHRVSLIHDELARQGHLVVGVLDSAVLIHDCVLRLEPDVVIVDSESPTRDTLENLSTMSTSCPRAVVVFSEDASQAPMQQALKAGVSAYVIAGLQPQRQAVCTLDTLAETLQREGLGSPAILVIGDVVRASPMWAASPAPQAALGHG